MLLLPMLLLLLLSLFMLLLLLNILLLYFLTHLAACCILVDSADPLLLSKYPEGYLGCLYLAPPGPLLPLPLHVSSPLPLHPGLLAAPPVTQGSQLESHQPSGDTGNWRSGWQSRQEKPSHTMTARSKQWLPLQTEQKLYVGLMKTN